MAISKKVREQVFNKYFGRCAYCGCELEQGWQVDHALSKAVAAAFPHVDVHHLDNLMPVCKPCNHYKREKSVYINQALGFGCFRNYMSGFHLRFARYPKKPRDPKSIKRKAYMQDIADRYGITPEKPFSGVFYFETLSPHTNDRRRTNS